MKPRILAEAAAGQAAARIAEHAARHRLGQVHIVLHGGEPLLLRHARLRTLLTVLRSTIDPVTRLDLRIHTNGVLLDGQLCALFDEYRVKVGVSLDGDRAANDRHRRFPDGRSSHTEVRQALALLRQPEHRHLYAGILCTVDLANDPIAVYEALLAESPPQVDLLLPHATWDRPPDRPPDLPAPYAAWLGAIHTRWVADGRPVPIRFFDSLVSAWEGRPSSSEAVGLDAVDLLVIETGGDWEQTDSLKTSFDGAAATSLDVFSHSVDEAAAHPGVAARRTGLAGLCATCRACEVVRACGGGLYAHRYMSQNGFDNPSVYCADLKALIPHVTARPPAATPAGHVLPDGTLESLAAGPGSRAAMMSLLETRSSVTRALVAAVAASLDHSGGGLGRAAAEGWALLSRLDEAQPDAVREIFSYPCIQAWAARCLRPPPGADLSLDRAHLAGIAAAAALWAGIETDVRVPVRDGVIHVPAYGAATVTAGADRTAVLHLSPSGLRCDRGIRGWQTVRRVSTAGLSVTVEDIDPFRDCQVLPATGRLSSESWQAWRLGLAGAARHLASEVPAYADALAVGLRSVVPLRPDPSGRLRSGTARQAFGAVAITLPADAASLSVLLLHEMQHVKLAALLDLVDLFDRASERLFQVSWRAEPRPIDAVMHGIYAHLAIAELWRARAGRAPGGEAARHFRTYRAWVTEAIDDVAAAGVLTAHGERFVAGMRSTVGSWADAG